MKEYMTVKEQNKYRMIKAVVNGQKTETRAEYERHLKNWRKGKTKAIILSDK